jgi:hypothetical protein
MYAIDTVCTRQDFYICTWYDVQYNTVRTTVLVVVYDYIFESIVFIWLADAPISVGEVQYSTKVGCPRNSKI